MSADTKRISDIRLAHEEDEESLMVLLHEMHAENGMATLDEEKVRDVLHRMITRQGGVVLVIHGPDEIEAALGLAIGSWWYSQAHHLEDLFCFVRVGYRRSTHAKSLLEAAKHYALGLGLPLLMGVLSAEHTAAKVRLYRRQLPEAGALFVFNGVLPAPATP